MASPLNGHGSTVGPCCCTRANGVLTAGVESAHASDHGHSSSSDWIDAVDGDTCVPDVYAQKNYVEDFAQVSVLEVYRQHHGGALPPGFSADCMSQQLAYVQSLSLYAHDTLFGNSCAFQDDWSTFAV